MSMQGNAYETNAHLHSQSQCYPDWCVWVEVSLFLREKDLIAAPTKLHEQAIWKKCASDIYWTYIL